MWNYLPSTEHEPPIGEWSYGHAKDLDDGWGQMCAMMHTRRRWGRAMETQIFQDFPLHYMVGHKKENLHSTSTHTQHSCFKISLNFGNKENEWENLIIVNALFLFEAFCDKCTLDLWICMHTCAGTPTCMEMTSFPLVIEPNWYSLA